ncbi:MAG: hypothetical protein M0015_03485 [Betaproteobacteria bacterium]|nr:hypothetical protein [Betaproteobacteria bacterium]
MRRTALLAVLGCALAGAAQAARAQELGRLFFTPEQRAALEARRKARLPDMPATPVIESPVTTIDGYVQRSGGRSTVWVNGEPVREGTQPEGMQVYPGADPTQVGVSVGDSDRRFELRVGQSLERDTGTVKGVLGGGTIRVEKPAPAPSSKQGPR